MKKIYSGPTLAVVVLEGDDEIGILGDALRALAQTAQPSERAASIAGLLAEISAPPPA